MNMKQISLRLLLRRRRIRFHVGLECLVHEPVVPIEFRVGQTHPQKGQYPPKDFRVDELGGALGDPFETHRVVAPKEAAIEGTDGTLPG
eukprot:CAMPEP_0201259036 /NCGR_PEP_ID=MMETSP0853-20130426/3370_1 /ASSEMBLY_ACC=CAM_ASM_000640 /TAXON_ID=183588 /ORGANISM="Pseudo-nitzschia fraudulenta, Strain WWA7" /LENGTH=88 /DNA_ID=CAMNT_0047560941 /DNA_START=482 /DNA_END=748 /DNA_ORIENTATION=-